MKKLFIQLIITVILFSTSAVCLIAENKHDEIMRKAYGFYDLQKCDQFGTEYWTTNFGIFGLNFTVDKGGVFWPRQSDNQYIFAAGFWFGAQKMNPAKTALQKYSLLSYNPGTGKSWFVPGRIDDGDVADSADKSLYRIYISDDFGEYDGIPNDTTDGENWPLWNKYDNPSWLMNSGSYIADPLLRHRVNGKNSPLTHPHTQFCTFKDTDLSRYEDPMLRASLGYPLRLQVDQRIFSNFRVHSFAPQSDNIILQYLITNKSTDTLLDCYFSSIVDPDLAIKQNAQNGAANDLLNYYSGDGNSPEFAYAWTQTDLGELGKGFGYVGVTFLEVPPIGTDKYIDKSVDIKNYTSQNASGIYTFRNWSIQEDPQSDVERYNFLSSGVKDANNGPGDKRILLSTYPFNLRPGESVRIAVLIAFAKPARTIEANGSESDIENLINNIGLIFKDYNDFGLDVNENENISHSISPNPATDYIEISASDVILSEVKDPYIKIFNTLGEYVIKVEQTSSSVQRINVSHLAPGIYFVRVGNEVRKFVKI